MKSGIASIKRNPFQKSSIVLCGESVAITPIKNATGLASIFSPKAIITNDRFLALIFGESALIITNIAVPIIRKIVP
nr:hypothetical protein [Bacillus cereus]